MENMSVSSPKIPSESLSLEFSHVSWIWVLLALLGELLLILYWMSHSYPCWSFVWGNSVVFSRGIVATLRDDPLSSLQQCLGRLLKWPQGDWATMCPAEGGRYLPHRALVGVRWGDLPHIAGTHHILLYLRVHLQKKIMKGWLPDISEDSSSIDIFL